MKPTITKAFGWLLAIVALSMTNCGGGGDGDPAPLPNPNPNPNPTACVLTRMVDDDGNRTIFSYNAQGYVSTITHEGSFDYGGPTTTYIYDSNNRVIRLEYQDLDEGAGYTTYTYTDGLITKSEHYNEGALVKTENFVYDLSDRVERITDSDGNVTEFTYNSAGNITEVRSTKENEPYLRTYEGYDDKKNPFSAVKGYLNLYGSSENNPLEETAYYKDGGEEMMIRYTYTYEYNELGLPTSIEQFMDWADWSGTTTTNLTYQCN